MNLQIHIYAKWLQNVSKTYRENRITKYTRSLAIANIPCDCCIILKSASIR